MRKPADAEGCFEGSLLDDWLGVLDFYTCRDGHSPESARLHGGRLLQSLIAMMDPASLRVLHLQSELMLLKFSLLPPRKIRDFVIKNLGQTGLGGMERSAIPVDDGPSETGRSGPDRHRAGGDDSVRDSQRIRKILEQQPVETWERLKSVILDAWRSINGDFTDFVQGDLVDIMAYATEHVQRQMLTGCAEADHRSCHKYEYEAVTAQKELQRGWDSDKDRPTRLAIKATGKGLPHLLKLPAYSVHLLRSVDPDSWYEPHSDEYQLAQIGLFRALLYLGESYALGELKCAAFSGELLGYLQKAAKNNVLEEKRREYRRVCTPTPLPMGIEVDEGGMGQDHGIGMATCMEIPDYSIEDPEGGTTTLIEQAANRQSYEQWRHGEDDMTSWENRQEASQRLAEMVLMAKLTPRQLLVYKSWDMANTEIARILKREFGKPVKTGAVRKQRHDLTVKLREIAVRIDYQH